MIETGKKSIQSVGLAVISFSAFIILSNASGAFVASILKFNPRSDELNNDLPSFIFGHYKQICMSMTLIESICLIGGIYIRKYKIWANQLITIMSIILTFVIWIISIVISQIVSRISRIAFFQIFIVFNALVWSAPMVLLIRFLNRKNIKIHFT